MSPKIYYVSGLPRSGSTLLINILGQNPNHHVTPTNGLLGILKGIRASWMNIEAFRAQGLSDVEPRIKNLMKASMYGFYQEELGRGRVVFDKNRMWIQNIDFLEAIFDKEIKIICTTRDVRAVFSSFEKLYRRSPLTRFEPNNEQALISQQTIGGRASNLLAPGGVIGTPIAAIRDAINRGYQNRLIIVPYGDLVTNPEKTMERIHSELELQPFNYDFENINQITKEDDILYGWGDSLHSIRRRIEAPTEHPWAKIVPPDIANNIASEFEDINLLARQTFV